MTWRYEYLRARSLAEAFELKARHPEARWIAGGTDVIVKGRSGADRPGILVSLRRVPELAGIRLEEDATIGALTTLSELLEHPDLLERHGVLGQAVRTMATVQIRNAATIGGNLCHCSPCADTAPAVLVSDARMLIASACGTRQVPAGAFFLGPGQTRLAPDEVLAAVVLPVPPLGARSAFLKKRRAHVDLALASVALVLAFDSSGRTCTHVRVAAGAVAPVPMRLRAVEALLHGREPTPDLLARAVELAREAVRPIDDIRASADYRRHLVGVYLQRAVEGLLAARVA